MFIINKTTLKAYEKRYKKAVTDVVEKFMDKEGLTPIEKATVERLELLSNMFWAKEKMKRNHEYVSQVQKSLERSRRNEVVKVLLKMGLNRNGSVNNRDEYNTRTPLLSKGEKFIPRKKKNLLESVWVMHRNLAGKMPYFTMHRCSVESEARMHRLFPKIEDYIREKKKEPHIDKTHNGFALGNTVTTGAPHGDKEKNISGSVQWAPFFDDDLDLEREFFDVLPLSMIVCNKKRMSLSV